MMMMMIKLKNPSGLQYFRVLAFTEMIVMQGLKSISKMIEKGHMC